MEYLHCLIDCIYFLQDRGIKPDTRDSPVILCYKYQLYNCCLKLTSVLVGRLSSMACLWWSKYCWSGWWYLASSISSRGVIRDTGPDSEGELVRPSWKRK